MEIKQRLNYVKYIIEYHLWAYNFVWSMSIPPKIWKAPASDPLSQDKKLSTHESRLTCEHGEDKKNNK